MVLPRCWAPRVLASWPISSSITRAGIPASSSQVAKLCRKSWAPRRSTASCSGSPEGATGDQRRAGQATGGELIEGGFDGGGSDGSALASECGHELVSILGAGRAEHLEHPGGGR